MVAVGSSGASGIHGVPGRGARVTATLAVAGVDSLFVNVDRGGGTYLTIPVPAFRWGVGGGASDVRLCSSTDPDCPALGSPDDPRLVVAGGGSSYVAPAPRATLVSSELAPADTPPSVTITFSLDVDVAPAAPTVAVGTPVTFSLHANGVEGTAEADWSMTGGSCDGATCTPSLPGTHTVTGTYWGVTATATLTALPTAVAGPDDGYRISEGDPLTLSADGSSDGDYTWDVDGDGDYDDATGADPTLSWEELVALGIDDGPSTHTVALRVTSNGVSDTAETTVEVDDTLPTTYIEGDTTAVAGEPFTIKVGADDSSPVDLAGEFDYVLDWGDGTPIDTGKGPADPPFTHTYTDPGTYTAAFRTGYDGQLGEPLAVTITVDEPPAAATPPKQKSKEPGGADDNQAHTVLPDTGASVGPFSVLAGVILIGAGSGAIIIARRRPS